MFDLQHLKDQYFAWGKPVEYRLKHGGEIQIKPIMVSDMYEYYMASSVIRPSKLDDESTKELSHLQFMMEYVIKEQFQTLCLYSLLHYTLGWDSAWVGKLVDNGEYMLMKFNEDFTLDTNCIICEEDWEDIKRIILYQNDPDFDDTVHLDESLRKDLAIQAKIRNKNNDPPDLERKIWIIASHTGILPEQQYQMTLRGFECLYNEVIGESEFYASYALRAKYAEKGKPADHWIWRKKRGAFDHVGKEASGFLSSLGMDADSVFAEVNKTDEGFKNEVTADEIEEIRRKIAAGEF